MRVYYHPSVGDYAKYDSFELDQAALAGVPSGIAAGVAGWAFKRAGWEVLLASLGVGGLMAGAFGAFYPKRVLSWFNPPPFDAPIVYPRQVPKVVVPSLIGEPNQVLNLLIHEGAGGVAKDYSPNRCHARLYNTAWQDGAWGWGVYFNGTDAYAEVPDNAPSLEGRSFTIILWWYPFYRELRNVIVDKSYASAVDNYLMLQYYADRKNLALIFYGDDLLCPYDLTYERWYHIGATFDYGTRTQRLFLNGSLLGERTARGVPTNIDNVPLRIAYSPVYGQRGRSIVAMLSVYDVDKGASFIGRHYEATRAIFGA